jgi:hypothetical protein
VQNATTESIAMIARRRMVGIDGSFANNSTDVTNILLWEYNFEREKRKGIEHKIISSRGKIAGRTRIAYSDKDSRRVQ